MRLQLTEANCVNPIQPDTINETMRYYRSKSCLESRVSLLYSFESKKNGYTVVSDACADIMVHYNEEKKDFGMELVGPHDHLEFLALKEGYHYFGIRFLPGYSPTVAGAELMDLKGEIVSLEACPFYNELSKSIRGSDVFLEQCKGVMTCINRYQEDRKQESSQSVLHQNLLDMILSSAQNHSLKDLEEYSGYSARYLNKIFQKRTGYSIIQFSNVLRAQRVGNYLIMCSQNCLVPSFDAIAAEFGYSDQSHMIREFKKNFGMTPKMYYQTYCKKKR